MAVFPIPKNFQRLSNFPLDSTYLYTNLTDLETYATTNPTAYAGQICAVADGVNVVVYKINEDLSVTPIGEGTLTAALTSTDITVGVNADAGASTSYAREDHVHGFPEFTTGMLEFLTHCGVGTNGEPLWDGFPWPIDGVTFPIYIEAGYVEDGYFDGGA